jgi:DNA-binding transcriptional ArsR family regulator
MLTPVQRDFIDRLSALLVPMGMTPIEARVHALLIVLPEPVSLDEMVDLLGVAKSSASVAARELERHGVTVRVKEKGTKRVRYALAEHGGGFLAAQVIFLGEMGELLRGHAAGAGDARIAGMGDTYLRLHHAIKDALAGS